LAGASSFLFETTSNETLRVSLTQGVLETLSFSPQEWGNLTFLFVFSAYLYVIWFIQVGRDFIFLKEMKYFTLLKNTTGN
jgi:hypothetical protein